MDIKPETTDEVINPEVVDETELDKELEDSINSVQAGKALAPKSESEDEEEVKPEEKSEEPAEVKEPAEAPEETPKAEDPSTPPVDEAKPEGYDYRIPNKGKFESDESFEKRIELMDLVKKRKLAKTDEQREQISDEINTTKGQLKTLNGSDRLINPLNEKSEVDTNKPEEVIDESLKADKERLKALP